MPNEERTMVIDGDGHCVEPPAVWVDYVSPEHRDRLYPRRDSKGRLSAVVLGEFLMDLTQWPYTPGNGVVPGGLDGLDPLPDKWIEDALDDVPAGASGFARLEVHDAEGIDAAVLFPSYGLILPILDEDPIAQAGCEAVNRWMTDYCSAAPKELYAVATLPQNDPSRAANELRRAVIDGGMVAGLVRPNRTRSGLSLDSSKYDELWATAIELDVPMCIHNGAAAGVPQTGAERFDLFPLVHAAVHPFEGMLAFASLYGAGVFDRFPALRLGFMESGCGWAPFWLDRLDEHMEKLVRFMDPRPTRSATEIFVQQCIIGSEGEEPMIPYVQARLGEESVVWSSDYPHFDAELPLVTDMLKRTDLTDSQRDGALRRAAEQFYGLSIDSIMASRASRGRPITAASTPSVPSKEV